MHLTVDEIIDIHTLEIWRHGNAEGVRDQGLLETLVEYRVQTASNVFEEAAILLYTIAVDHPFFDGNKRTAFAAAAVVLRFAGYTIIPEMNEIVSFVHTAAIGQKTQAEIEKWLRENTIVRSDLAESL